MIEAQNQELKQLHASDGFGRGLIAQPLAIVSLACKLPGADNLDEFWQMLLEGRSAVGPLPNDIVDRNLYYDPSRSRRGTTYSDVGAIVNRDRCFERNLGLTHSELKNWDECHLYFADVASNAWQSNFKKPTTASAGRCGVYIGHSAGTNCSELIYGSYSTATASILEQCPAFQDLPADVQSQIRLTFQQSMQDDRPRRQPGGAPYWDVNDIARLTAKVTNTSGPHVVVESACASSSVALCLAGMALNANQIDVAIVGGASFNKSDSMILFSQAQSCSATDSRPFDNDADGLISSEGFVALVIKRLADAIQDGDEIHGVITGAGMASDGKGKSLWAPRHEGQIESMRRAYRDIEHAKQVQYLEAHATSTQVGDATETNALSAFFQEVGTPTRLPIGSVKSNLGHTLESAGLVGLVKVVLAMKHGVIPPSINFKTPNPQIPWDNIPLRVVSKPTPWPIQSTQLRKVAAVNAFGIGGLNVHLVIEDYNQESQRSRIQLKPTITSNNEIAIVGIGCVLPGASKSDRLKVLLADKNSYIQEPPEDRWFDAIPKSFADSNGKAVRRIRGGYITDFEFDWRKHRIPPKQVQTANPLQFMLLQAAGDALKSSGILDDETLWQRTAVVVGSVFGGEFGNGLQIGLRLQYSLSKLRMAASKLGASAQMTANLQRDFEQRLLARFPGLLDETGSFTSSTLASRITKHFNLMGGAFALDGSDESGAQALNASIQMLRENAVDSVVCASGSHSLDYVAYTKLHSQGLLPDTSDSFEKWPAEGVVTLALQRADDARKSGRKILGIIEEVTRCSKIPNRSRTSADDRLRQLQSRIGCVIGADALVGLAAACSDTQQGKDGVAETLSLQHRDGAFTEIRFRIGNSLKQSNPLTSTVSETMKIGLRDNKSAAHIPSVSNANIDLDFMRVSRWKVGCFSGQGVHRAGLVNNALLNEQCAQEVLRCSDDILKNLGSPTFEVLVTGEGRSAFEKIWAAQATVLIANTAIGSVLLQRADRFDAVVGHSLGELAALIFARSWTLETALRFVHQRAHAVMHAVAKFECGLLSVSANAEQVSELLKSFVNGLSITHINSPKQTVVGGLSEELVKLQALCKSQRISSISLSVPASYHCRVLEPARWELLQNINSFEIRPPELPVLSTVSGRFDSEPDLIRQNLLDQLITPVNYVRDIERLEKLGSEMFVEVGTESVLTKLHKSILLQAQSLTAEEYFGTPTKVDSSGTDIKSSVAASETAQRSLNRPVNVGGRRVIDATSNRRAAMRQKSEKVAGAKATETYQPSVGMEQIDKSVLALHSASSAVIDRNELQKFIIDFIVEHTGYPIEMVDPAWDLEAELGVDSIKQAQLFGELQQTFSLDASKFRGLQISSIDDICNAVTGKEVSKTSLDAPVGAQQAQQSPNLFDEISEPRAVNFTNNTLEVADVVQSKSNPVSQDDRESELCSFMVDFVVEHTGYPKEMVDLDAEFEADLGIDSIKLAQLIGEIRSSFKIELTQDDRKAFLECKTLRDIASYITSLGTHDEIDTSINKLQDVPAQRHVAQTSIAYSDMSTESESSSEPLIASSAIMPAEFADYQARSVELPTTSVASTFSWNNQNEGYHASDKRYRQTAALMNRFEVEASFLATLDSMSEEFATSLVAESEVSEQASTVTQRYVMRMLPQAIQDATTTPLFHGRAAIVGENEIADALQMRLSSLGVDCVRFKAEQASDWPQQFLHAWKDGALPHLFITTPHDHDAYQVRGSTWWNQRMECGIDSVFWLTQKWYSLVCKYNLLQDSSLVVTPNLGGGFGFESHVQAPEGGAIGGLAKALVIEAWMAGQRRLNFKIVDLAPELNVSTKVDAIFTELAYGSYDTEIGYDATGRSVVRAVPSKLSTPAVRKSNDTLPQSDDVWICTGGARGISAYVIEALASRYRLRLNLIGTTALLNFPNEWHDHSEEDRRQLKLKIMQDARAMPAKYGHRNPLKVWQDVEKSIEIDSTLNRMRQLGLEVQYFACDVADASSLARIVEEIRQQQGPIRGILHGAGVGQDSRFERKLPDKVRQCFGAKLTGAFALLEAVDLSELKHFIAFGSISGRFGANGHTDYSAANDGLMKICDWLRESAPSVRTIGVHWHAWGDIGMATKPETKLALESVGMQFMPAVEGLEHLIREIESKNCDSEVLVTDDRYYRAFYPAESVSSEASLTQDDSWALLENLTLSPANGTANRSLSAIATLLPKTDPFLVEHTFKQRPLLPIVVDIELMIEASIELARKLSPRVWDLSKSLTSQTVQLQRVKVHAPLKFFCDEPHQVHVSAAYDSKSGAIKSRVTADALNRNAHVVGSNKLLCDAEIGFEDIALISVEIDQHWLDQAVWHRPHYSDVTDLFYSGAPFRLMHRFTIREHELVADVTAPSLVELAGLNRNATGWVTPSALLDVAMYASGILAWQQVSNNVCLPTSFERLSILKRPRAGQRLRVFTRLVSRMENAVVFDFDVQDEWQRIYMSARGYQANFVSQ